MAAVMAVERESLEYAECELRLIAWGRWSRRMASNLGYPKSSGIARMIEMVKVFKPAEHSGRELTAKGKETRSMRPLTVEDAPAEVMEIDRLVANLPGWMHAAVSRSYRFRQPDRIAARELRMSREQYTLRREAAVSYLAEKLALRRA
ncbi:MAG TPA: hypothetical protein VF226_17130 [Hyphomicrobiaceae bacterium]